MKSYEEKVRNSKNSRLGLFYQAKITICNLDGTKDIFITDPDTMYGENAWGVGFYFENGRRMIIQPNFVHRIIIEEAKPQEEGQK